MQFGAQLETAFDRVEISLTIMFSDVCGSTELVERLGDRDAFALMRAHHDLVREALADHGGREIELRGDGVLAVFHQPRPGLRCALDLQTSLRRLGVERPEQSVSVRIGLHCGTVIPDGDKYFGRNVILAARLADVALPREVLVSENLRRGVGADAFAFGEARLCALKGFAERQRAYPVRWNDRIACTWPRLRKTGSTCSKPCSKAIASRS